MKNRNYIIICFFIACFTSCAHEDKSLNELSYDKKFLEIKFNCKDNNLNLAMGTIFRISKNNYIRLPYIGDFYLDGKNEKAIAEEIRLRSVRMLDVAADVSVHRL